ncbi:hypothetical protein F1654_07055 [Alkalicaulis satelles]|uniref:Uncharacterized protein n=1 Tax=Alkalicaulis satelles TaxID=2609175 RepID=A0A5M6ZFN4_9PROT|nr:hypothetical protein [Alkalicaulis satelles]KAA5803556.1 hypothetical protein F1654_07055 [Alkalicaulis satelles]
MIRMLIAAIAALSLAPAALADERAYATPELAAGVEEGGTLVTADILGMVCDFCAVAMTRTFGRRAEVSAVHIDLDDKTLQLVVREGHELTDATITDLVRRSGYQLTGEIRRGDAA